MRHLTQLIRRLARQQRRRLWLTALIQEAYLPLAWIALLLLVAGTIHQAVREISLYPVGLIACLSLVLYLPPAVKKRPSLTAAVTHTDLQLKAHALFIAAWEMAISSPADSGVQPLIMARVEKQLPLWRQALDRQTYPRPGTPLVVALGLSVIGGLLLLLPGKPVLLMDEPAARQATQPPATDIPDPVAVINEILLLEQHQQHAAPQQNPQPNRSDGMQQQARLSDSSETDRQEPAATESQAGLEGADRPTDARESTISLPESSHHAEPHRLGRSSGKDSPHTPFAEQIQAAAFQQQQGFEVEIDTRSDARAFNPLEGRRLLEEQQHRLPEQAFPDAQPAARGSGSQLALHRISPEQRALVIRYFEQLSQANETTP